LLASASNCDWTTCQQASEVLADERLRDLFSQVFRRMQPWDSLPRAFELVEFTFELILSAACFGQLKRHRMASLIVQPYETALGRTVPASIARAGLDAEFHAALDRADSLYDKIAKFQPQAAPYALTNAHRRRAIFAINGRALGHLARLRCDHEAQWDIREVAHALVAEAQRVMPLAGAFYGGKDCFEQLRTELDLPPLPASS
jgi:thymidylate synthase ThyX